MKFARGKSVFHSGFFALTLIIILLIILVLIFSQQILTNISQRSTSANTIALVIIILFPAILAFIILYEIVVLVRDRTRKKPGTKLKVKLVLFFVFISFLTITPLSLLSVNFIQSTINFWLRAGIGDALQGGLNIALNYYRSRVTGLKRFNESRLFSKLLENVSSNPDLVWEQIQEINSEIGFIQIYDPNGKMIVFRGDRRGRLLDFASIRNKRGILPKIEREDISILRSVEEHSINGHPYIVVTGMVLPKDFDRSARNLTESLETFNQLNRYNRLFKYVIVLFYFFFTLPVFLLVILFGFMVADELIKPIVSLEEATRRVSEGDFSFRILTRRGDELYMLAESFNKMIGELEASREKLLHAEKITAWQEIAQRLAHEIRNPLTPIKLSAQRILRKYEVDPDGLMKILPSAVNAIISEVNNLDTLLKEFREFARLPNPLPQVIDLREIVEEVSTIFTGGGESVTVDISGVKPNSLLKADPVQTKQIFNNLIKNAMDALGNDGRIVVRADMVKKGGKDYWRIQIRDNGVGIDEDLRDKIFDPYFTTKEDGTGLGLAIVERIVFDHNGNIWFESKKGVGTTFFIDLPVGEIDE